MQKAVIILCCLLLAGVFSACSVSPDRKSGIIAESNTQSSTISEQESNIQSSTIPNQKSIVSQMNKAEITINSQKYDIELYNNQTAKAFINLLPMTVTMQELNGNEKFYYLPEPLPTDTEEIGEIKAGDIMLWGNDCLVLFYKNFSTSYSYTKIGKVKNADKIISELNSEDIKVTFQKTS